MLYEEVSRKLGTLSSFAGSWTTEDKNDVGVCPLKCRYSLSWAFQALDNIVVGCLARRGLAVRHSSELRILTASIQSGDYRSEEALQLCA